MPDDIQAIFFDIGDTLAVRAPDPAFQDTARRELVARLGTHESPDALLARVEVQYHKYAAWRQETLVEIPPLDLWTKWLLPGSSVPATPDAAEELTVVWRNCFGRRTFRPGAVALVRALSRGYVLGIISNTISSIETPNLLREHDLTDAFATVLLSAAVGIRKPCPEIFLRAVRDANVRPEHAAYVGDRPSRDVAGPRSAGFRMTCLLDDTSSSFHESSNPLLKPDLVIHELDELLNVLPLADFGRKSTEPKEQ